MSSATATATATATAPATGPAADPGGRARPDAVRLRHPAGFLALWANDDHPDAPFLAWAVGRPVHAVADRESGLVTHCVDVGEGIEVRITPDTVGDDPVLRIDMQCEGATRAYLDIDDVGEYGHAGALLAEIRERLTPHYLVDAVVRTEATYQPAPSEDDLVAFDHVIRRLNALLPADEPGLA